MLIGIGKTILHFGLIVMLFQSARSLETRAKHLTQQQIKNKFTLQWNELKSLWDRLASAEDIGSTITKLSDQVDTLEADITTLQAHEEDIATSFEQKCQNLDTLLDPDYDCCLSDDKFQLYCHVRAFASLAGYDLTKGVCSTC